MAETAPVIKVFQVTLPVCEMCLSGVGGNCYVPGCSFWMKRAPDGPLWQFTKAVTEDGEELPEPCPECGSRLRYSHMEGCSRG